MTRVCQFNVHTIRGRSGSPRRAEKRRPALGMKRGRSSFPGTHTDVFTPREGDGCGPLALLHSRCVFQDALGQLHDPLLGMCPYDKCRQGDRIERVSGASLRVEDHDRIHNLTPFSSDTKVIDRTELVATGVVNGNVAQRREQHHAAHAFGITGGRKCRRRARSRSYDNVAAMRLHDGAYQRVGRMHGLPFQVAFTLASIFSGRRIRRFSSPRRGCMGVQGYRSHQCHAVSKLDCNFVIPRRYGTHQDQPDAVARATWWSCSCTRISRICSATADSPSASQWPRAVRRCPLC
jgi:hypothetical protein